MASWRVPFLKIAVTFACRQCSGTLSVVTSTVLTRELLLQKNKSRVVSVVSVILVGWDTSCWRNLSAVMFISWLHNRPFNTAVSPVDAG